MGPSWLPRRTEPATSGARPNASGPRAPQEVLRHFGLYNADRSSNKAALLSRLATTSAIPLTDPEVPAWCATSWRSAASVVISSSAPEPTGARRLPARSGARPRPRRSPRRPRAHCGAGSWTGDGPPAPGATAQPERRRRGGRVEPAQSSVRRLRSPSRLGGFQCLSQEAFILKLKHIPPLFSIVQGEGAIMSPLRFHFVTPKPKPRVFRVQLH